MKDSVILYSKSLGLFLLILLFPNAPASAADYYCDFQVNGIYYQFITGTDNEVAVSYDNYETGRYGGNYTNYTGVVTVPEIVTYEGKTYRVTAVSSHAFQECSVTSVNLPSTIKSIGVSAFLDCNQLWSVNIPLGVTSIGISAFNGCVSLSSVTIPKGIKEISDYAFENCRSLTSVVIPDSVKAIGNSAFYGCSNLATIVISENVQYVGDDAFYGTAWLNNQSGVVYIGTTAYKYAGTMPDSTSIALRDGTTMISKTAFSGCSGLVSISIPETITTIGTLAFQNCTSLKTVTLPKSLRFMGNGYSSSPFYGCTELKDVTILCPIIGSSWFRDVSAIEKLTFGDSVMTIGSSSFLNCKGLSSVVIPKNVTEIQESAFSGCSSLETVTFNNIQTSVAPNAFYGTPWMDNQPDGLIYIGQVAYTYKGEMPIGTEITLREDTKEIAEAAFSYCTGLESIKLNKGLKRIRRNAFSGCSGLISIVIPDGVEEIGSDAFSYCKSLGSVSIPSRISTIADNCFYGCQSLASVKLPEELQSIGNYAFQGCTGLTSLRIPKNVNSIGVAAFANCSLNIVSSDVKVPIPIVSSVFSYYSNSIYYSYANTALLFVPAGCKPAYENADVWKDFKEIVELDSDPAELDNAVYVEQAEILLANHQFSLPIQLKNRVDVAGVSFTLTLPEGMTLATDEDGDIVYELNSERLKAGKFSVFSAFNEDGSCGIRIMPTGTAIVSGTEGTLLTLKVQVADTLETGDYPVVLTDNSLSVKDNEGKLSTLELDNTRTTLTIITVQPGDVNGDERVDLTDAIMIVYASLGVQQTGFNAAVADMNVDGRVDLTDAIVVVYKSLGVEHQSREAYAAAARQAFAQVEHAVGFAISDVTLPAGGTVELPVGFTFETDEAVVGFQLNLNLPDGVTTVTDEEGLPTCTKDDLSCPKLTIYPTSENGFAALPQTANASIKGTSGTLFTITLQAADSLVAGTELTATVTNAMFTLKSSDGAMCSVDVDDFAFAISISETAQQSGDLNGDGEVGIGDIVAVTNAMAGVGSDTVAANADVNGDGEVGIGDIVAITNIMAGNAAARQQ